MDTDHIVMTPKCKTSCSTTLAIERRAVLHEVGTDKTKVHVAGGDHRGIVINKEVTQGMNHIKCINRFVLHIASVQNGSISRFTDR